MTHYTMASLQCTGHRFTKRMKTDYVYRFNSRLKITYVISYS